jgi:peptidoglycan/xylan/chitin deacetylase (PgdA/CDA1 family)
MPRATSGYADHEPRLPAIASRSGRLRSHVLRQLAALAVPRSVLAVRGARNDPRKRIALTFDDGPDHLTTRYLDALSELAVPATFFLIGENAAAAPDVVAEVVRRGHEIGGHGWSHTPFPAMRPDDLLDEIRRTASVLPSAIRLVRPPRGSLSLRALLDVASAGYVTVLWSVDSDDCRTRDPAEVAHRLSPHRVRAGDIILMHEMQPWSIGALHRAVPPLRDAGFVFTTVGDLIEGASDGRG